MREQFAFLTAYWQPHRRVNVYGAFRINRDGGEGDRVTTPLAFVNSYPYQAHLPYTSLRVSFGRAE